MSNTEHIIFRKFKKGDEKAFEYLFRAYNNQLFLYARSILLDKKAAEDIVKDYFMNLWLKRDRIVIESSVKAYFFTGIKNRCLNHIRDEKKKLFSMEEIGQDHIDLLYAPATNPILEKIYVEELRTKIERTIDELPEQRKLIFKLSRYDNFSHNEIAAHLSISVNTVKVQIYRALEKLREVLI